ncbi:polysaccharide deacetylase family protein [Paenibacillus filicis]|uniref:Polysaccharide deacetylase family protein n=1 Tax=Paenibacillus filicis TaxID=669464 RepID=A0ABU9DEV3_9BACL
MILFLLWPAAPKAVQAQVLQPDLYIGVNEERLDFGGVTPEVHDEVAFAPVRVLAEAMHVELVEEEPEIRLSKAGHTLVLRYHENLAVNDKGKSFVMWQFVREGKLLVPVSYLAGYFGYEVTSLPDIPMLRLKNSEATRSDKQFEEEQKAAIEEELEARKPPIYLTFDDGPSKSTLELLDHLKSYRAKATFFMLGNHISTYPDAVKRMVKEGHQPGLHGMTHVNEKFYKSPQSALDEMNQANKRLLQAAEVKTSLIRTPYGSKPLFTGAYRDATAGAGYRLWDWNVDSNDWKYTQDPDKLYEGVLADIRHLKSKHVTPVVLFHDEASTVAVLPRILEALREEGYRFAPLNKEMEPVNFWHDLR